MSGEQDDAALRDLAQRAGIATEWYDFTGRHRMVSPEALRHILAALGLPCHTADDLHASSALLNRPPSLATLPPLLTAEVNKELWFAAGAADAVPVRLELEDGSRRDVSLAANNGWLCVPAIETSGYHRLRFAERAITLAVAPARCRRVNDIDPPARRWGMAAQVYGVRRNGDGGIGDAAGVAALAQAAARRGADALALSPLHALFTAEPVRFGPYSPSSRLFLNPLHAAPALVLGETRVAAAIERAGVEVAFRRLESLDLIDWPDAAAAKLALLRALFETWEATADDTLRTDFAHFTAEGGDLLAQHAIFEALHAVQCASGLPDWRRWPDPLRDPAGGAVAAFAASHHHSVAFHVFLQWLADRSLGAAQAASRQAGMRIGLIGDLAVGMDPSGSHAWSRQNDVMHGLAIGAPPDLFNQRGQEWGLAGFSPRALVEGGFAPFLATLRAVLRNAGGVRIDHAMGLTRLWLVPQGASPADGAYLSYPFTDLLRLLVLESHRHDAVVVGEDLGTVPEGFREAWEAAGAHGIRVMWFERDEHGFKHPSRWDAAAVATTSTHDLPTVAGWWRGSDITTRVACGQLAEGQSETGLQAERAADRAELWRTFEQGRDAPPPDDPQPVVDAALGFVARTPSPLCLFPVEDVLGLQEQPNLPGTTDQHPNWRRRLPGQADTLLDAPHVVARLQMVEKVRKEE